MTAASKSVAPNLICGCRRRCTGGFHSLLIGPPVIGFIAHALGLSVALGFVSLTGAVLVIGATVRRWK